MLAVYVHGVDADLAREVAAGLGIPVEQLRQRLARSRELLRRARSARPPPLRDDKVLVAWNGLMISAFARAGFAWQEPAWTRTAATVAMRQWPIGSRTSPSPPSAARR